ncbi:MAG TPA: hypothetical protein VHJ38_02955 [Nitrososphaeraceae archaeon]|nr:hypothetical protein [Nitrososphaeraceae archaeon]
MSIYDSFTLGDFLIEITINSDETKTHRIFELHVDRNYINLQMKMLPLSKKENIKYQFSKFF